MKTGFIHTYAKKPLKKYYSYHGIVRDCLIQPDPEPFEEFPIAPPYGPLQLYIGDCNLSLGILYKNKVYITGHDKKYATSNLNGSGQTWSYYSGYFFLRHFFSADTSDFPIDGVIESGFVHLVYAGVHDTLPFITVLQWGGGVYPHTPYNKYDFNQANYSGNYGELASGGPPSVNIPLNGNGIGIINRFGNTKFCIRSNHDINGTPQRQGSYASYGAGSSSPKIYLYYRLPL